MCVDCLRNTSASWCICSSCFEHVDEAHRTKHAFQMTSYDLWDAPSDDWRYQASHGLVCQDCDTVFDSEYSVVTPFLLLMYPMLFDIPSLDKHPHYVYSARYGAAFLDVIRGYVWRNCPKKALRMYTKRDIENATESVCQCGERELNFAFLGLFRL